MSELFLNMGIAIKPVLRQCMVTKMKYTIADGPKKGIQAKSLFDLYTYTIELWCEFRGLWYTRSWVWSESFWGGNYIQTCFIPKRHKVLGNHLFVLSCFLGISVNQKSEGRYMRNNMVYLNPHSWVFSLCSSSFSFPLVIQHITYKHAAYLFLSSSSTRLSRGVKFRF